MEKDTEALLACSIPLERCRECNKTGNQSTQCEILDDDAVGEFNYTLLAAMIKCGMNSTQMAQWTTRLEEGPSQWHLKVPTSCDHRPKTIQWLDRACILAEFLSQGGSDQNERETRLGSTCKFFTALLQRLSTTTEMQYYDLLQAATNIDGRSEHIPQLLKIVPILVSFPRLSEMPPSQLPSPQQISSGMLVRAVRKNDIKALEAVVQALLQEINKEWRLSLCGCAVFSAAVIKAAENNNIDAMTVLLSNMHGSFLAAEDATLEENGTFVATFKALEYKETPTNKRTTDVLRHLLTEQVEMILRKRSEAFDVHLLPPLVVLAQEYAGPLYIFPDSLKRRRINTADTRDVKRRAL